MALYLLSVGSSLYSRCKRRSAKKLQDSPNAAFEKEREDEEEGEPDLDPDTAAAAAEDVIADEETVWLVDTMLMLNRSASALISRSVEAIRASPASDNDDNNVNDNKRKKEGRAKKDACEGENK